MQSSSSLPIKNRGDSSKFIHDKLLWIEENPTLVRKDFKVIPQSPGSQWTLYSPASLGPCNSFKHSLWDKKPEAPLYLGLACHLGWVTVTWSRTQSSGHSRLCSKTHKTMYCFRTPQPWQPRMHCWAFVLIPDTWWTVAPSYQLTSGRKAIMSFSLVAEKDSQSKTHPHFDLIFY